MLTLETLSIPFALALLALGGVMVFLLTRLLRLQGQQLQTLEAWLAEQRAMNQQQLAQEHARTVEAQANREAEVARAQQVVASRQSMADAVATLRQLKRQFA